MFPRFPILNRLFLGCFIVLLLLSQTPAQAWPWNSEPQPLLRVREPIRADAGSPLAWDQSARALWFLKSQALSFAHWNGWTFNWREFKHIHPEAGAGLAVDPGWHFLYYAEFDRDREDPYPNLHCLYRSGDEWRNWRIGDEPISKLLGVDVLSHAVFAYDPQARGIRRYALDWKTGVWSSSVIAYGLGEAGDAAAIDSSRHIIYSSHETAASIVPRHPKAQRIGDPTKIGAYKPWPLVETKWNGDYWSSRVIDETGVPQQPAVRALDRTVFYAKRDDGRLLRTFKAARNDQDDIFASLEGWTETDTFEDHGHYKVRDPQYPAHWLHVIHTNATLYGTVTVFGSGAPDWIALKGPITVVPVYAPVWSDRAMPPRLTRFRALLSPREGRLVVHTERCDGEVVRKQTGKRLVGYLYRDANGVLARQGRSTGWLHVFGEPNYFYGELGADYDPANPPADHAALADPLARFHAVETDILSPGGSVATSFSPDGIPANYSTDPDAPFVLAHLRLPTSVSVRTFGHDFISSALNQPGARFQHYRNYGTDYAMPSAIAVDRPTGVTFYTQAPPRAKDQDTLSYRERYSNPPLAGFRPEPDPKLPSPDPDVWIAMVYDGSGAFVRKSVTTVTSSPVTAGEASASRPSAELGRKRFSDIETTRSAR